MYMNNNFTKTLPDKKMLKNNDLRLRKDKLTDNINSEEIIEYYNIIITGYLDKKYDMSEYLLIKENLSVFYDYDLKYYKNNIFDILKLNKEDSIKVIEKIKECNVIEIQENKSYSEIIKTMKELMIYIRMQCTKLCELEIKERDYITVPDKVDKLYEDIKGYPDFYSAYIITKLNEKYSKLYEIEELKSFIENLTSSIENELIERILIMKRRCDRDKMHKQLEDINNCEYQRKTDKYLSKNYKRGIR